MTDVLHVEGTPLTWQHYERALLILERVVCENGPEFEPILRQMEENYREFCRLQNMALRQHRCPLALVEPSH